MFSKLISYCWVIGTLTILPLAVDGHRRREPASAGHSHSNPEHIPSGHQAFHKPAPPVPTTRVVLDGITIFANTTGAFPGNEKVGKRATAAGTPSGTKSTFLVLARDTASSYSAYSGLNDYGIPYEVLIVPSKGVALPTLQSNDQNPVGNYGGIVVLSEVSYTDSSGDYASALTAAQWTTLYNYQTTFGVRMVRLDSTPSSGSGTKVVGTCCDDETQEQNVYLSDTSQFTTAGLKQGATLSTLNLYHYAAAITDTTTTTAFASFAPSAGISGTTVAGVINNFSGRQQMVFFMPFSTDWALTSGVLTHAWIHWATRGLYAGYRRMMLSTQVDDMFLKTLTWDGVTFRISVADLATHVQWQTSVRAKMPTGSNYTIEIGHNGNGNIESSEEINSDTCPQWSIVRNDPPDSGPLEFVKPLGTGTNMWPTSPPTYHYTDACIAQDPLGAFFKNANSRDSFMHISHTYSHEDLDNATYSDAVKEITWNQQWLAQIGIANAKWFSPSGIIPPAITGLHNGDALRAWEENGIVNVVGDSTRPALLNSDNEHWPLITTVANDGYAGVQVTPRWASDIYYDCSDTDCEVGQWNSFDNDGDFSALMLSEKTTNVLHLMQLHHGPFMFHQANLRWEGVSKTSVNGVSSQYSLLQIWVETMVAEVTRIATWPIITHKHDDLAALFRQRMARDQCKYTLTNKFSGSTITGVTVAAPSVSNKCSAPIPVTIPGALADDGMLYNTEQIGSDPLTIWVTLNGKTVDLTLKDPVAW